MTTTIEELERRELIHTHPGMKDEDFMRAVDATGGWPAGFTYVSFYHAVENKDRCCKFTNHYLRTGWWTTLFTADDYYWWKVSEKRKEEIRKKTLSNFLHDLYWANRA